MKLEPNQRMLETGEIFRIMETAKEAGVRSMAIPGTGEPTLDRRLKEIVKKANEFGFLTLLPTNASTLTAPLVELLRDNNVTLVLSIDTTNPARFVELTGTSRKTYNAVMSNARMAQEVYAGTREKSVVGGKTVELFRITIEPTINRENEAELAALREMLASDTLLAISPLANIGSAKQTGFGDGVHKKLRKELYENHIAVCTDPGTGRRVCGFFRFGVDISHDGQLLLEPQGIQTAGMFGNIRDMQHDVRIAYGRLEPIKKEFVAKYLNGDYCASRCERLDEFVVKAASEPLSGARAL
ncbi:MAG: radical SAM protein [Candidatus Marsarchaeota archaeon]|nr:radical SAM protein [Candidatus Marsarchaeota archaeon]